MKTRAVQFLFFFVCTVFAAALQDMWPVFGGAKPPFLLALVLHWTIADRPTNDSERHPSRKRPFYAARWIPVAVFAGALEDALSGFPIGCATGFFLLAGGSMRFMRSTAATLSPAAFGLLAVTLAAPLHELWLAVWGVAGDDPAPIIRFFASAIPAAPVGAVIFFLMPRLEKNVGFEGPEAIGGDA